MKNILVKSTLLILLSFGLVQISEAHGRYRHHRNCDRAHVQPRHFATTPAPRYHKAPQVYRQHHRPVFIQGHWAQGRHKQVWIPGHYR